MALKLAQSDENVRPDWWRWSVWLEGGGDELDRVSDVTYLLHPTFPEPVRVVSDRSSAFRLDSAGWGEFMIRADVRMGDGTVRTIHHELELHVAEPPGPASDVPQVFLSHSAIDGRLAAHVSRELESHGVKVIHSAAAMSQSSPAEDMTRKALQQSHVFVALQSDTPSKVVADELSKAQDLKMPVVHVRVGAPPSQDAPQDHVLYFQESARPETIAKKLMQVLEPITEVSTASTGAPVVVARKPGAAPSVSTVTGQREPGDRVRFVGKRKPGGPSGGLSGQSVSGKVRPSASPGKAAAGGLKLYLPAGKAAVKPKLGNAQKRRG